MQTYGFMFDSAAGVFPAGCQLRAVYYNGRFATRPYQVKRGQIWIDVLNEAPRECSVLDVENGDATPADVPGWLNRRNPIGRGTIYCNRSTLPAVIDHAGDQPFDLWLSTLDGTMPSVILPHGELLAVQAWRDGQADKSAVVDREWWNAHALAHGLA